MGAMSSKVPSMFKMVAQRAISAVNQKKETAAQSTDSTAQAAQPAERTSPFSSRPRGQAANILAGEEQTMTRQKRLLGE